MSHLIYLTVEQADLLAACITGLKVGEALQATDEEERMLCSIHDEQLIPLLIQHDPRLKA